MIFSSGIAKGLAALTAIATHVMIVAIVFSDEKIAIEGGPGEAPVSIGSSFADMAKGTLGPEAADEAAEVEQPEVLEPVATAEPVAASSPQKVEMLTPGAVAAPVEPQGLLKSGVAAEAVPEAHVPTQAPEQAVKVAAMDTVPGAVARSLRPKTRSAAFETRHKPVPVKRSAPQPKPKAAAKTAKPAKGNANQSARAGAATGAKKQPKATSSGTGRTAAAGNAAISNYPGQVMKRISRVSRPRVGAKGTAVVAFRIAPNGGLAGVSLSRSSGSANLDKAALNVIRRAAPFPPPPKGAQRSFSINVSGR